MKKRQHPFYFHVGSGDDRMMSRSRCSVDDAAPDAKERSGYVNTESIVCPEPTKYQGTFGSQQGSLRTDIETKEIEMVGGSHGGQQNQEWFHSNDQPCIKNDESSKCITSMVVTTSSSNNYGRNNSKSPRMSYEGKDSSGNIFARSSRKRRSNVSHDHGYGRGRPISLKFSAPTQPTILMTSLLEIPVFSGRSASAPASTDAEYANKSSNTTIMGVETVNNNNYDKKLSDASHFSMADQRKETRVSDTQHSNQEDSSRQTTLSASFERLSISSDCRNYTIEEWIEREKKEFHKRIELFEKKGRLKPTLSDFEVISPLGDGTFGAVYLTQCKLTSQPEYLALKVLKKSEIIKKKQIKNVENESKFLYAVNFPFCIRSKYSFQDSGYLYLAMEFVNGGEFFYYLQKCVRLKEQQSKFYAAQVVLAFQYLHSLKLIYRDLKPENILLSLDGYIKLVDFGFTKIVQTRTYTLCGTPEFLAPEVILQKPYHQATDWWALGVLIYEMTAGANPFSSDKVIQVYEKITSKDPVKIPPFFSKELASLIHNLIQRDITKRYGNLKNGIYDVREDPWFDEVDWDAIFHKRVKPPYKPSVKGPLDTKYFEAGKGTVPPLSKDENLRERVSQVFENF